MRQIEEEERRGLLGLGLEGGVVMEGRMQAGGVGDVGGANKDGGAHSGANGVSHRSSDAALQEGKMPAEMRREMSDAEPSYVSIGMSSDALSQPPLGYGLQRNLGGNHASRENLAQAEDGGDGLGNMTHGGDTGGFSEIKL